MVTTGPALTLIVRPGRRKLPDALEETHDAGQPLSILLSQMHLPTVRAQARITSACLLPVMFSHTAWAE